MMSEQAKAARRAYKAEWARKNPDKVRAQQERYWAKRAAKEAAPGPTLRLPGCEEFPTRYNCRGCVYSAAPELFDGRCIYHDLDHEAGKKSMERRAAERAQEG